mgnify:FL=1|tara:strand:+ start:213 stop:2150 length:1938 start_codon:yes stop_codon:yes gene_type:complete
MKLIQAFLSAVFSLLLVQATAQNHDFELCKIMESEAKKGNRLYNLKSVPQTAFYDVNYYRLELIVQNPTQRFIEGKVTSYFTALDSGLNQIVFDLSQQLVVDSVSYQNNSVPFNRSISNAVSIQLPNGLQKNQLDSITIFYRGIPTLGNGFGSFVTQANTLGDTTLWTLSEPYGALDWWPCKNSLTDKADSVEIIVATPLKYKVATNGLLMNIDTISTFVRYHWKTTYPIATYLVAIAISEYDFYEEQIPLGKDSLLMQHFLFKNESLSLSSNGIAGFLHFFDSLFGEYPFIKEKYGHASFTLGAGAGMEHQTMSFMGGYGGELKAHELAHQWFGNKITCGSWKDLWLNEGFATYLTALTYEFGAVHDPFYYQIYLNGLKGNALNYRNGSVYRTDTTNVRNLFNGQVYSKGAYSLHMLRWLIGDSAFFSGVRNYINDSSLVYGFAYTEDLKQHFENSSNQNLDEFFDDWIFGKGYPMYNISWSQNSSNFQLTIDQTPSDTSVSFFNIPLPFRLSGASFDTTIIVNPTFSGQVFNLLIPQNIQQVEFDPENWILALNNIITSIDALSILEQSIQIYPNPAKDYLFIEFPDELKVSNINLYRIEGKQIPTNYNVVSKKIDLNALPKGIYMLQLEHKTGRVNKKFIKQ